MAVAGQALSENDLSGGRHCARPNYVMLSPEPLIPAPRQNTLSPARPVIQQPLRHEVVTVERRIVQQEAMFAFALAANEREDRRPRRFDEFAGERGQPALL